MTARVKSEPDGGVKLEGENRDSPDSKVYVVIADWVLRKDGLKGKFKEASDEVFRFVKFSDVNLQLVSGRRSADDFRLRIPKGSTVVDLNPFISTVCCLCDCDISVASPSHLDGCKFVAQPPALVSPFVRSDALPQGYRVVDDWVVRDDGVRGKFYYSRLDDCVHFASYEEIDFVTDNQPSAHYTLSFDSSKQFSDTVPIIKRKCKDCLCMVNPIGHHLRCSRRPPSEVSRSGGAWSAQRVLAWFGDALHHLDVRTALVVDGVPSSDLGNRYASLTDSVGQANWFNSIPDRTWLPSPSGSSDHNIATAFECGYLNPELRRRYLHDHFGEAVAAAVIKRVPVPDLTGLEFK